jgi:hypothetical protein
MIYFLVQILGLGRPKNSVLGSRAHGKCGFFGMWFFYIARTLSKGRGKPRS